MKQDIGNLFLIEEIDKLNAKLNNIVVTGSIKTDKRAINAINGIIDEAKCLALSVNDFKCVNCIDTVFADKMMQGLQIRLTQFMLDNS